MKVPHIPRCRSAELAFDAIIGSYALKYAKAADYSSKDRDTLLALYDFPAEHWKHPRRKERYL
jgi:transposase-like protein